MAMVLVPLVDAGDGTATYTVGGVDAVELHAVHASVTIPNPGVDWVIQVEVRDQSGALEQVILNPTVQSV